MIKLKHLLFENYRVDMDIYPKANFTKFGIDDISNDILMSMSSALDRMLSSKSNPQPRGALRPESRKSAIIYLNYLINNGLDRMGLVANKSLYLQLRKALQLKISGKFENRYDLTFE